jgi:hypothetical protein
MGDLIKQRVDLAFDGRQTLLQDLAVVVSSHPGF